MRVSITQNTNSLNVRKKYFISIFTDNMMYSESANCFNLENSKFDVLYLKSQQIQSVSGHITCTFYSKTYF